MKKIWFYSARKQKWFYSGTVETNLKGHKLYSAIEKHIAKNFYIPEKSFIITCLTKIN